MQLIWRLLPQSGIIFGQLFTRLNKSIGPGSLWYDVTRENFGSQHLGPSYETSVVLGTFFYYIFPQWIQDLEVTKIFFVAVALIWETCSCSGQHVLLCFAAIWAKSFTDPKILTEGLALLHS